MSYRIYAGTQSGIDEWDTKVCIYAPGSQTDTAKLISPTLTREVGKAGSLEFTVPLGNVAHSALQKLRTVVSVEQDGQEIWQGRVMSHEQDFLLRQKVFCEGELAYLNDSAIAPYTAQNLTITEFLSFLCTNHNKMTDSYKRFTVGNVQAEESWYIPCLTGCSLKHTATSENSDGSETWTWSLLDKSGNPISSQWLTASSTSTPPELAWTVGEEHLYTSEKLYEGGFLMSRTGSNKFRIRLNAVYTPSSKKTWKATISKKTASAECATCKMDFGSRMVYDLTDAPEQKTIKVTQSGSGYTVKINGTTATACTVQAETPLHTFGDGKNYGKTWEILQSELVDVYGGYLMVRRGTNLLTPSRLLDFVVDITDENEQGVTFGTNLLDLTSYVKAENIVTRVIAVGKTTTGWFVFKDTSTITATANDTAAQKLFGIITNVIVIDGTSSTKQSLQDAADEELAKNLRYLDGITVKAVDLRDAGVDVDRIAFAKKTHILSAPHGVDAWLLCTKLVEPMDNPGNKSFTFGIEFSSISDLQALSARKAATAYDMSRTLKGYAVSTQK